MSMNSHDKREIGQGAEPEMEPFLKESQEALGWILGAKGPCAILLQASTESEALRLVELASKKAAGVETVFVAAGRAAGASAKEDLARWALEFAKAGKTALLCAAESDAGMAKAAEAAGIGAMSFTRREDWMPERWAPRIARQG